MLGVENRGSPGLREPHAAAIAALVGPDRNGAAGDGIGRQRAEVAPVKACWLIRIEGENFAGTELMTAAPDWQRTPHSVVCEREGGKLPVDGDAVTEAADALAGNGGDALQERDTGRQIAPLGE